MKKLFFDMDGVLVDSQSGIDKLSEETKREYEGRFDEVPDIFSLMNPMSSTIKAAQKLSEHYEVYIFSTIPGTIFRHGAKSSGSTINLATSSRNALS